MKALLSSTYFGPIQWYQKLNRYDECLIERHESFIKQTYRNRMIIPTTNGPLSLTIPTNHDISLSMKDIRISDHANWRHVHWNALLSAYGESPFFEYYADDLHPFFERPWHYLLDFNTAITHTLCTLIGFKPDIHETTQYLSTPLDDRLGLTDYREAIRPKHALPDPDFSPRPYYQVYAQRFGFQPNLSILDLLFNMGNEAVLYL